VLLADDQELVRVGLKEPLRTSRPSARSWTEPMPSASRREGPDVVLLDIRMPVVDALTCQDEMTDRLRKGTTMSERPGADDPFGGRQPTSHERLSGQPWDASYQDGPAPWDIGRPQPAIVRLGEAGGFTGSVLDAGCGTGENALYLASLGLPVLGVDVAESALAIARGKAKERGAEVEFVAADALHLERLGRRFDTVLDCALFHTFDGDERPRYVASLASATEHGGTLYVLCFSDQDPHAVPHPVSRDELEAAFTPGSGWVVAAVEPDRIPTRSHDDGLPAWLVTARRT
jgi:SAM-dependent methyltransferase